MREIVGSVLEEIAAGRPFALVTLVGERGSTPRAAGAQMMVRADGSIVGTIGGGLLEATMMGRAAGVIRDGRSQVASLRLAGRSVADEEMLCGGSAEVLIAYVGPGDEGLRTVAAAVAEAVAARRRARLLTLFGPAPDAPDAPLPVSYCLLTEDGQALGEAPCAIGDLRRLVNEAHVHGAATLPDGRRVHVEVVEPPTRAVICGAGHVALAMAPLAAAAGFPPVVIDDRPEFAAAARFPDAEQVLVVPGFGQAFASVGVDESSYIIIVTRGHRYDFEVLTQALRTPAAYIGLMASRSKWTKIEAALRELGFGDRDVARVHCPIGLAIGAETPAELAVSIVAELIKVRAGVR